MPRTNGKPALLLAVSFVLIPVLTNTETSAGDVAKSEHDQQDTNTCLLCHDTPQVNLILNTTHAQKADPRTPFAANGCETCHGASLEHLKGAGRAEKKHTSPDIVFGTKSGTYPATSIAEQNKICLNCHETGNNLNWRGSQHQFADVACSSCHRIHSLNDPVLDKLSESHVCYTCHVEQRAQAHRPSRHPIKEGKVGCSDCHNPHGGPGPALLVKNTVNETCYLCHAEKRGPFLWEHQPVREDCMVCHSPHGTTQPRMLKVRTPYLCNMCHSEDRHPSTLRSGTGVPPAGADDRLLAKDCMNCHSQVHGTNHPSGTGLTR